MTNDDRIGAIRPEKRGLRQAGESSWVHFFFSGLGAVFFYGGVVLGLLIGAGAVLAGWLIPIEPWMVAAGLGAFAVVNVFTGFKEYRKHRSHYLGAEGERSAARDLERLRADGWHVLHDVKPKRGEAWNIDHVLVGPAGVFAIETKNWSKPEGEGAHYVWDGEALKIHFDSGAEGDAPHGGEAIAQAARNAATLSEVLEAETGRSWRVHAVLALPNWFVRETPEGKRAAVRVCNPGYLAAQLSDAFTRLPDEDVALLGSRVEGVCTRG